MFSFSNAAIIAAHIRGLLQVIVERINIHKAFLTVCSSINVSCPQSNLSRSLAIDEESGASSIRLLRMVTLLYVWSSKIT